MGALRRESTWIVCACALGFALPAMAGEDAEGARVAATRYAALVEEASTLLGASAPASPSRSATPILNELNTLAGPSREGDLSQLTRYLERPDGDQSVHGTSHFLIHYDPSGSDAPTNEAYVLAAAEACERAWKVYHQEQGWPHPWPDDGAGDDDRIDVYIRDLGWGVYGYALHEERARSGRLSGFMVVDNDYAGFDPIEPLQALQTTLAHEYHHLVQFRFGYDPEASWFMEQLATMEEGAVYPDIRLRERLLPAHFENPHRRFDLCNGTAEYATWLWPQYLADRWGWGLVIDAWFEWEETGIPMLEAIGQALGNRGSSLDEALVEWATWNVFLGARDDGDHYQSVSPDVGGMIPEGALNHFPVDRWHPQPMRQPECYGVNYVELRPQGGSADNHVSLHLDLCRDVAAVRLVIWRGMSDVDVRAPSLAEWATGVEVAGWHTVKRAWLVLVNGPDAQASCDYALSVATSYRTADVDPEDRLGAQLKLRGQPNPFEPFTVITFELPAPQEMTLTVHDAEGRIVRTLLDGAVSAGSHGVYWNGDSHDGVRMAAGIYYARMRTPLGTRQLRLVRIR